MTRMSALFCMLLLSGCTVDISSPLNKDRPLIALQRQSSAPQGTYRDIVPSQLQAGDLLFSSSIGATSVGIRLFSIASVSHVAIYIGDGNVAEAIGSGVHIVSLKDVLTHSDKLFVLRDPALTEDQARKISEFARLKQGKRYNFGGIAKMIPFMITRQFCALNPFSSGFRQQCVAGLASAQLGSNDAQDAQNEERYFCSQFVIAAYRYAGQPLTNLDASWISPSDLLHMREGDIATIAPVQSLQYIGHLSPGIYFKTRQLVGR